MELKGAMSTPTALMLEGDVWSGSNVIKLHFEKPLIRVDAVGDVWSGSDVIKLHLISRCFGGISRSMVT